MPKVSFDCPDLLDGIRLACCLLAECGTYILKSECHVAQILDH